MEIMICQPRHHLIVNQQRSKTPPPHLTFQSLVTTVHAKFVVVTPQVMKWSSFGPIWSKSAGTYKLSLAVRDGMEAAFNTTQMQAKASYYLLGIGQTCVLSFTLFFFMPYLNA